MKLPCAKSAIPLAALLIAGAPLSGCDGSAAPAGPFAVATAEPATLLARQPPPAPRVPVMTASLTTAAATAFCKAPKYPAIYLWDPGATVDPPGPVTSGKPRVEQYRAGTPIATYATLGSYDPHGTAACGPFSRYEPFRQRRAGDRVRKLPVPTERG